MIFRYTFPAYIDNAIAFIPIYIEADKCPAPNEVMDLLKSSSCAFKWMHEGNTETNRYELCIKAFDGLIDIFPQLYEDEEYKSSRCHIDFGSEHVDWDYHIEVELIDILKI